MAIPLVRWEDAQLPIDKGDLGMCNLHNQNKAFMLNNDYQLVCDEGKLWVQVLKSKYKWRGCLPQSISRTSYSRLWIDLSNVWEDIRRNICWYVRDGLATDFWYDIWLDEEGSLADKCLSVSLPEPRLYVHAGIWVRMCFARWGDEDLLHILCDCSCAIRLWNSLIDRNKISDFMSLSLTDWLSQNICPSSSFTGNDAIWSTRFVTICWQFWKQRCAFLFDGHFVERRDLLSYCNQLALEFSESSISLSRPNHRTREALQWIPPSID
ncbi:hypothetical protein V6N11_050848 [Hibiscus sabdariffa]|uniref:Reverse transcriptase zinc-binding domain-containing protein n=2 Tax=Hibiscus sabdariffa TaxID=183260 RepID=A0ABR2AK83_9ROSI